MRILGIARNKYTNTLQWALGQKSDAIQTWVPWNTKDPEQSRKTVLAAAKEFKPDFAVVWAIIEPSKSGIIEDLAAINIPAVAPGRSGAELEASKTYAYNFARQMGILVPEFALFTDPGASKAKLEQMAKSGQQLPVLKPDGLPAGTGVRIPVSLAEACSHIDYLAKQFPTGHLHQERIYGKEFSLIALSDGESFKLFPSVRSYKKIQQAGLTSSNTGCVSPVSWPGSLVTERALTEIVRPTLSGMKNLGQPYKGFINLDVILGDDNSLYLIDYNCGIGSPEFEAIAPRLNSSFAEVMSAAAYGKLNQANLPVSSKVSVCVTFFVTGTIEPHAEVSGIPEAERTGCLVFAAGLTPEYQLLPGVGRPLFVVGLGDSIQEARAKAYEGAKCIKSDHLWHSPFVGQG